MTEPVDLLVLGGGPGGYAAALRAACHGLSVTIVEGDQLGGTCLHQGCIPSKALLHVARLADAVTTQAELGLVSAGPGLDTSAAGRFRDGVIDQLHRGLEGLVKQRGIEVVRGWGTLRGPGEVMVASAGGERLLMGRNVLLATGSFPAEIPGIEPDGLRVLRSDDALRLDRVPACALVIGGGAVGVEFASLWRSLGAAVTLVEAAERLLPLEDPDSSKALERALRRRGIDVRVATAIAGLKVNDEGVTVSIPTEDIRVEQVLVAVGRRPRTSGIGIDHLLDDRGYVRIDPWGQTSVDGVWAVGDAVATLALAHAAFAEGFVVADAVAGRSPQPVDHRLVPRVTYSTPEVASLGVTEAEARADHGDVRITMLPLTGNARAAIEGGSGQLKLVHGADGLLLGAHAVGPSAAELIAELGLAISWDATTWEVGEVIHAHPSFAESVREAALAAAGIPFHAHVSG